MTDLEGDLQWLAAHQSRWALHHPILGVSDWTVVVWRDVLVRTSRDAEVVEAETLVEVLTKAAEWFRNN